MIYHTRIAPSPTGMMHLGTARTAIFNWLAAKSTGGQFILRIDDTDSDRNDASVEQPIFDGLTWLGLPWDAFYRQSERVSIYLTIANELLDAGYAYRADNGAILLKFDEIMSRVWRDEIKGDIAITDRDIETGIKDLVLVRGGDKLNQPIYHFTSIVDDYLMDINYIIRGKDHIANTGKQLAIWSCLTKIRENKPVPKFAHVGLVFHNKKKMSKRDGAASLLSYKENGYDPDGMFNHLLRLGWGPTPDDKASTFMDHTQALAAFLDHGNMKQSDANFDPVKLEFYNTKWKRRNYGK